MSDIELSNKIQFTHRCIKDPVKNLDDGVFFVKIVTDFEPLTIFTTKSIIDVWQQDPVYESVTFFRMFIIRL